MHKSFFAGLSILVVVSLTGSCGLLFEPKPAPGGAPIASKQITSHIALFFTDPVTVPPLEQALIDKIDAQSTSASLDLAFYGLDRENVITAIENAIDRGVHVRFVGDKDGGGSVAESEGDYYSGYMRIAQALDVKFPESALRTEYPGNGASFDDFALINSSAIMHNKIALFTDGDGKHYVYTGTTNTTDTCFTKNNNNALIIEDTGMFETYRQQFEYLLGLPGSSPVTQVHTHVVDGIPIDVLFSPQLLDGESAMDHLIDLVSNASSSIYFMIFSYPHMGLNDLMLSKFHTGLTVKGVFDESQLSNSIEEYYAQRGVPVRIDGNHNTTGTHGGKLHHKTMILDQGESDAVVVTGSFNWSNNANQSNNENMLFIHSDLIAQAYMAEWNARWNEGSAVPTVSPGADASPGNVIINEVMWMGSRDTATHADFTDEFIELRNMTAANIDVSGWALRGAASSGKPIIVPGGTAIGANGYLVLTSKASGAESAFSVPGAVTQNQVAVSNDSKIQLVLEDQDGTAIDTAGDGTTPWTAWAGQTVPGDGGSKSSMARVASGADGTVQSNWFTTSTQFNVDADYLDYTYATPGAPNDSASFAVRSVIISEVAWAGTNASTSDEWIELYNTTGSAIGLSGWTLQADDGTPHIILSGTIPAGKHFLLERTDDDSVPGKTKDEIYTGDLGNGGDHLTLVYTGASGSTVIDETTSGIWPAGSSASGARKSMERKPAAYASSGNLAGSWQTASGDVSGAQNSSDS